MFAPPPEGNFWSAGLTEPQPRASEHLLPSRCGTIRANLRLSVRQPLCNHMDPCFPRKVVCLWAVFLAVLLLAAVRPIHSQTFDFHDGQAQLATLNGRPRRRIQLHR